MLFELFLPLYVASVAILLLVLRAGASRVFFDVVGTFQAERLISDARAKVAVFEGLMLDGLSGIAESAGLLDDQLQAVVDSTVPLARQIAEARIEFEKFANFAEAATVESEIIAFGESIGFTADQALNAGSRMAQLSGVLGGGATVGAATEMGITFGLIGGMETQDAMTRLINLQQQTGFMQGELTKGQFDMMSAEQQANIVRQNSIALLDSLNTVENRSSATMSQITFVMNQFASSAQLAGDSIHFMAGASATLIEAGEEQGKAGRALRMMYARLGADTGGSTAILAKYGIAVNDATGQMRSMEDIMGDIAKSNIMNNKAELKRVAQAIAGNDHYVRAIKLMEGYDRAMQLTTESSQGLDSATSELNRRLEDEAVQLQLAEARLDNAKAALGDALIPAMTAATRQQAMMNEAFAQIASTGIGGFFTDLTFGVQQFVKSFAPFGEAMLNVISMNVSLKTQETIMRGLSGQDIARASAYGMRNAQEATSLENLRQELGIVDQLTMKRFQELSLQQVKLKSLVQIRSMQQVAHLQDLNSIKQREQSLMKQYKDEVALIQQVTSANTMKSQGEIADMYRAQQRLHTEQRRLNVARQGVDTQNVIAATLDGINIRTRMGLSLDERRAALMEREVVQDKVAIALGEAELQNQQEILQSERIIQQIKQNNVLLTREEVGFKRTNTGLLQLEINTAKLKGQSIQEQLNSLRQLKFAELEHAIQSKQNIANTQQETFAQKVLSQSFTAASIEVANALKNKANMQKINQIVTEHSHRASMRLAGVYHVEAGALQQVIAQLPGFNIHMQVAAQREEAMGKAAMIASQRMMMLNASLGIISMALSTMATFMGDSEAAQDAMQASMVIMTASMIVGTGSMFKLTGQTMQSAGAMMAHSGANAVYTASANTATGATNRLKTALIRSGIMAAVVAVGYAISFLIPNSDSASDSMDGLGDSVKQLSENVSVTAADLARMNEELDGLSAKQIAVKQIENQEEILELEKQYRDATNETTKDIIEGKLKALGAEKKLLSDIAMLRLSEQVGAGTYDRAFLQKMYDNARAYTDAADDLAEAESFDKKWTPEWAEDLLYGQDDMIADAEDAFDAAADAMVIGFDKGSAAFDLANIAENFEEFLALISNYGIETKENLEQIAGGTGQAIDDNIVEPIEKAKRAMMDFGNEREELFFGMKAGNITGDMLKQVVNKGVETLINTTELIMNNTFNGMTTRGAANEIIRMVEDSLAEKGVNLAD